MRLQAASRAALFALLAAPLVARAQSSPAPAAPARAIRAPSTGEPWRIIQPPQASFILARNGTLIGEVGRAYRMSVPLRSLPRYVPQAFIAVEDQRFYHHDGVDVVGVMGALKDNLLGGRGRGASTITQQLVGNMHPDEIDRNDRTLSRKLREQSAAREMERHYSKEQILEAYLNQILFGHGWYGIEEAARHYFGKAASALTLAEAATLAAMPKGPALYDPMRFPERVRARRNTVLALMAEQRYVTRSQAVAAQREPLVTTPDAGVVPAPYFLDVVRRQATDGGVALDSGGYRVYTSLDPALQRAAVAALADEAAAIEARPGYAHPTLARHTRTDAFRSTPYLQGMVVAVDPSTGEVRALVGGRDYRESPFNRALNALRQPGSAFKPIVYAAAVADSIAADSVIPDTAIALPLPNGRTYRPVNADGLFLGSVTLREALVRSRNVVAVQLAEQVGIDTIASLAHRLGIHTPVAPYPSSAIGASAVEPLELVAAYTAFATLGVPVVPRFVERVEDAAGRVVWTPVGRSLEPVLDPRVAFIVRDMMRDVVERGTAQSIRRFLPESIPVAGKTGTTNDNTDVWFVGLTPDIVAGVWLGFDRPKSITPGAAGGTLAAPVWGRMMAQYYAGRAASGDWTPPPGLVTAELDRETGQLADSTTAPERRYTEYFLPGTEPGVFDPWSVFQLGPVGAY